MSERRFATPLDLTEADTRFRERFWSKVDRGRPDECWPWLAYCKPGGYGQFTLRKGFFVTASRVALALTLGRPLVAGELACHSCDNPPCCNPAHLFAGDARVNTLDSVHKGRANRARGEQTAAAKLDPDKVREIRSHQDRFGLVQHLSREYGVCSRTIRSIRLGQSWRHVA